MKNIKITFRLSPQDLARGLQAIRQIEPNYKLISLNELAKRIYLIKSDQAMVSSAESLEEILNFTNKPISDKITITDLINMENLK